MLERVRRAINSEALAEKDQQIAVLQVEVAQQATASAELRIELASLASTLHTRSIEIETLQLKLLDEVASTKQLITKYDAVVQSQAVLQAEYQRVLAQAGRFRAGTIMIDPIALTARLRAIVSSIKIESTPDRLYVYADRQLTEPEWNAVKSAILNLADRT